LLKTTENSGAVVGEETGSRERAGIEIEGHGLVIGFFSIGVVQWTMGWFFLMGDSVSSG
jgi:hypothetical protein